MIQRRARRSRAAAVAIAALVGCGLTAPSVSAAPAQPGGESDGGARAAAVQRTGAQAGTTARRPRAQADSGFSPVKETAGQAVALTSPRAGYLWVVSQGEDGKAVLEYTAGRRTRTMRLPVNANDDTRIDGTAPNDVWLTSGGELYRFDGRRWSSVRLPGRPGDFRATTVTDVWGPDVYVGLEDRVGIVDAKPRGQDAVYRLRGNVWTSLGKPANDPYETATYYPARIAVAQGKVFAEWQKRIRGSVSIREVFALGRQWQHLYQSAFSGGGSIQNPAAWLVPSPNRHWVLGSHTARGTWLPWCLTWVPGSDVAVCESDWNVGGADILRDGSIIVGSDDVRMYDSDTGGYKTLVEGVFGLQRPDGTKRTLSGDPGTKTIAVEAEPGTNRAWALTMRIPEGSWQGPTYLQRYSG